MRENINAQWAKETATKVLNEKITGQINKCLDEIEMAVKRNEFDCVHFGGLHELTIKDITKRGFSIEKNPMGNQMDGTTYTITW